MRATSAHSLLVRRPSYSPTELMAVAELELPYIPSHESPRMLQSHREPFWRVGRDSAGSLRVEMTPCVFEPQRPYTAKASRARTQSSNRTQRRRHHSPL